MINNLFLGHVMLVPKPFGTHRGGLDQFEQYFRSLIPDEVTVQFVTNWDSYYLLEGDINCGTNTRRQPFNNPWWSTRPQGPQGAYDV